MLLSLQKLCKRRCLNASKQICWLTLFFNMPYYFLILWCVFIVLIDFRLFFWIILGIYCRLSFISSYRQLSSVWMHKNKMHLQLTVWYAGSLFCLQASGEERHVPVRSQSSSSPCSSASDVQSESGSGCWEPAGSWQWQPVISAPHTLKIHPGWHPFVPRPSPPSSSHQLCST